jgi:hypothetical protein
MLMRSTSLGWLRGRKELYHSPFLTDRIFMHLGTPLNPFPDHLPSTIKHCEVSSFPVIGLGNLLCAARPGSAVSRLGVEISH